MGVMYFTLLIEWWTHCVMGCRGSFLMKKMWHWKSLRCDNRRVAAHSVVVSWERLTLVGRYTLTQLTGRLMLMGSGRSIFGEFQTHWWSDISDSTACPYQSSSSKKALSSVLLLIQPGGLGWDLTCIWANLPEWCIWRLADVEKLRTAY